MTQTGATQLHRDLVPIEVAHQILITFGITERTKEYERWVKPDGIDFYDLHAVLGDSPFILNIDWCAVLQDELQLIVPALAKLGVEVDLELEPYKNDGWLIYQDKRAYLKFNPSDDDFLDVIQAIQNIMPPTIEFRASPNNGGSDSWDFAVLRHADWLTLESIDAELAHRMYVPLPKRG